jgi:hypothetical protein
MRVRFLKDLGAKEGQGSGPHYEKDKEYDFTGAVEVGYARSYIDRGFAVDVADDKSKDQLAAQQPGGTSATDPASGSSPGAGTGTGAGQSSAAAQSSSPSRIRPGKS